MPAGLQVWDENGLLVVDTNDFLGRIVGSTATGFSDGSTSADLSTGTPFAFSRTLLNSSQSDPSIGTPGAWNSMPEITVSASSVSWVFPAGAGGSEYEDCYIYYGVY